MTYVEKCGNYQVMLREIGNGERIVGYNMSLASVLELLARDVPTMGTNEGYKVSIIKR